MHYHTVYDIAAKGYEEWLMAYIAAGLATATLVVFLFFRTWKHRKILLTVFCVFTAVAVALPYWDYTRLKKKLESNDCLKTEGIVTGYWEKKWRDKDASNKWHDYHYEGFTVNSVKFGYYITGGGSAAGFQNNDAVRVPIRDGMRMRVHYYDEPIITDGTVDNRILKIEVAE
ncbi:hypothetical protein [Larkinella rosea]|uniref:Uncharacterized protein n=1 Tax=Larkinella rosea TaxID=2025312 RepID=A0A3P1BRV7_9BACT|nr:hypothetical protein [Larkinella rosea]RRB03802.1 hypothetical protein EHT25_09690 [Larkinella rosea]